MHKLYVQHQIKINKLQSLLELQPIHKRVQKILVKICPLLNSNNNNINNGFICTAA